MIRYRPCWRKYSDKTGDCLRRFSFAEAKNWAARIRNVLSGIFYPKRWQIPNSHFGYNKSFIAVINKIILIEIVLSKRKSLSKLLQMLTALWRKRRCPDFCLTWRNIKGFSVSSVMILNRLASSERLTQVRGS